MLDASVAAAAAAAAAVVAAPAVGTVPFAMRQIAAAAGRKGSSAGASSVAAGLAAVAAVERHSLRPCRLKPSAPRSRWHMQPSAACSSVDSRSGTESRERR